MGVVSSNVCYLPLELKFEKSTYFITRNKLPIKKRNIMDFKYNLPIKHKGLVNDTGFIFM